MAVVKLRCCVTASFKHTCQEPCWQAPIFVSHPALVHIVLRRHASTTHAVVNTEIHDFHKLSEDEARHVLCGMQGDAGVRAKHIGALEKEGWV